MKQPSDWTKDLFNISNRYVIKFWIRNIPSSEEEKLDIHSHLDSIRLDGYNSHLVSWMFNLSSGLHKREVTYFTTMDGITLNELVDKYFPIPLGPGKPVSMFDRTIGCLMELNSGKMSYLDLIFLDNGCNLIAKEILYMDENDIRSLNTRYDFENKIENKKNGTIII